jgi:hypothetical protein
VSESTVTDFGFRFGSANVTRMYSDAKKGWVLIGIETPKHQGHSAIQVYVTRTGKVRVFGPSGEWLPQLDSEVDSE